ncbi:MAG: NAD(P)/FAD-dependent oxidoreductase [Candidatus Binatia bacterium]
MANYDAIIIGAGHNGLVTAAYLAKAGKKVLVLERRPIVGGIAVTEEIVPGFKLSTVAHFAGSFASTIVADLDLTRHGLGFIAGEPLLFAPSLQGKSLQLLQDSAKAQGEIAGHSKSDAGNYPGFCALAQNLSGFLRTLYGVPLPDKTRPGGFNPVHLLKIGWKFHRLGEKEMYEFLRILPMSMADLLNEWFENDLLKAALAGTSFLGSFVGPRQQGTAFNFLHHRLGASNGALPKPAWVRGGIGILPQAIARAAQHFGAKVQTGAEVGRILTRNGTATGVALQNGEEILATAIISSADVKRTFLRLIEPTYLDPEFLLRVNNIRSRGTVAKINLALDTLPRFKSAPEQTLGGAIHIGPSIDYLERAADDAKYGRFSRQPFLEITIPSVADPSLAPAGKHVMSVWMQSAPYHLRETNWSDQRDALGDLVVDLIEDYAPGLKDSILHRQVLTPLDLEQIYGLTEGHPYHGEMSLDQIFFMRPIPGWARYGTPIENLYLCGSGTHPGGGITGLPGYYAAKRILQSRSRSGG